MKRGEKVILIIIAAVVTGLMGRNIWHIETSKEVDKGIPFYSTATSEIASQAMDVYRKNDCKNCHTLWTVRNLIESVPAPMLDGLGSLHSEDWFYQYFSSSNPQAIIPSRLKQEYKMPSYAMLPDDDRRLLAKYMASLKVKDWYLDEVKKGEFEKLTGKEYRHD
jgi:cbb3-type cytochrome oxidase cytochrome c subunit